MDDFDDIVLDDYDPFNNDSDNNNTKDAQIDPLAPANTNKHNKKRSTRDDPVEGDEESTKTIKKQRRKLKKLDHEILCSAEGLTRLRNETPWLKFGGKGHEDEDLLKLMRYYRMWAYKIYPRYNFTDFASRVMKASANKNCKMKLDQWREEYIFKNSPDEAGSEKVSHERVTGELSGMTLEDEDQQNRHHSDSDDESSSSSSSSSESEDDHNKATRHDTLTDLPDDRSNLLPTTNEKSMTTNNDLDDNNDEEESLFMNTPSKSSYNTNILSVDDFFAD
ncbi:replication fork protection component Swi3-domain-containing protein [Halteromyces radiatus]|uniref:replication fork protection component Swi3-domain-containing protein n=1 Tax=Halteromyces radiatus TaxID=101107 RepID=UPI00221EF4BD|nr:replication fork protection component Swi3-domain-containing protein [Halteromyces radiatus]KAI8081590.1 replication fork protection component Swi3-domain-containing protein [Halteromyces radiatus]